MPICYKRLFMWADERVTINQLYNETEKYKDNLGPTFNASSNVSLYALGSNWQNTTRILFRICQRCQNLFDLLQRQQNEQCSLSMHIAKKRRDELGCIGYIYRKTTTQGG